MKLIVGLGNPEAKYKNNRHNVGMMVINELLSSRRIKDLVIKKSDKFMNDSGFFVKKQMAKYPSVSINDLYVVHDDLDIPLGSFKIQFGKGPKGHNGIIDIEEKLGTSEFWRVRVGVENRKVPNGENVSKVPKGEDYVLEDFTSEEMKILENVIKQICNQLAV
jgi:PTH1 family peptidyl-tRNA hydrolase